MNSEIKTLWHKVVFKVFGSGNFLPSSQIEVVNLRTRNGFDTTFVDEEGISGDAGEVVSGLADH